MDINKRKLQAGMCLAFCLFGVFLLCTGFSVLKSDRCIVSLAKTDNIEDTYTNSQGLIFTLSEDGSCILSGHTGEVPYKLVIPSDITVSGSSYKVKEVGSKALEDCIELDEIEMSNEIAGIAPDAFLNCTNLDKIRIIPSKWTVSKSGKTALISMKVYSLSLPEDVNKEVVVTEDVLKKAVSYKNTEEIRLTFKTEKNGSFPKIVYGKNAKKILRSSKRDLTLRFVDLQGESSLIKIRAEDVRNSNGNPELSFYDITAGNDYGAADKDIKRALKKNGISKRNIRVFRYSSDSEYRPSLQAKVLAEDFSDPGRLFYVYRYISAERKFVQAGIASSVKASSGGIAFPVQKNGTYIISKKPFRFMVKKLSNEFVRDFGDTYYVDKKGNIVHGWMKKGENYYYFDRENGKMAKAENIDGIKLRLDGTAVKTEYSATKIDIMIKARNIVDKITEPTDGKEEKMRKSFYWVYRYPYCRFRTLESVYKVRGWELIFANDIFDRKMGSCTSDAAAVAFLFKECGCEEVYIASEFKHSWTEYNGRVYDAYFARTKEYPRYYNVPYESFWVKPTYKKQV